MDGIRLRVKFGISKFEKLTGRQYVGSITFIFDNMSFRQLASSTLCRVDIGDVGNISFDNFAFGNLDLDIESWTHPDCALLLRSLFFFKIIFLSIFSPSTHNDNAYYVMTALQCINSYKPYTLAGFEPGSPGAV
jgi:hypothetical protein